MKIGNVKLRNNVLLAPMHGITINAFRLLCKEYGAGLVYAPIMNENAVLNNPENVVDSIEEERPVGGQLIGKDALKMAKAAKLIEQFFDIIDINFGCPRQREVREGIGAVLLRKPDKVRKIVSSVVRAVEKPVTVKIRLGYKEINVLEVARIIEEAGAAALIVHARTGVQDYSTPADWSWIKKVKEEMRIPVIGNGDLFTPQDVRKMLDATGCDGVMIARGANGNPFIFRDTLNYLNGTLSHFPTKEERVDAFFTFLDYYDKYAKQKSVHELRTHAYWFLKGVPHAKKIRSRILSAKSREEIAYWMRSMGMEST